MDGLLDLDDAGDWCEGGVYGIASCREWSRSRGR